MRLEETAPPRERAAAPEGPSRGPTARVAGPLLALLGATFVVALAWALVTPAFQSPDENSHFGYVQSLADGPGMPGDATRPPLSTEQNLASDNSNADQTAAQTAVKMEWSSIAYERWRARQAALPDGARSDGGGPNPAGSNPPLYYVIESVAYRAASAGDVFDRLLVSRIASLLWLLVTVAAVWLLAGEVTRRDRTLQLGAASVAGLAPMMTFISASVTPDAMMFALWSLALWLGVRAIKHGLSWWLALALSVTVGAACCVKGTSYGLLPAAGFALLAGLWRTRPLRPVPVLATLLAAAAGLVVTLGVWKLVANGAERPTSAQLTAVASTSGLDLRMLLSYLWQFYLPRLPTQSDFVFFGNVPPVWDIWVKGVWGRYGWLEVKFPSPVYLLLAVATAAALGLAGLAIWRARRSVDWLVGAFLLLITATLLAGLHWTEFQQVARGGGPLNQGRYLLPLVGVAGLVVAQALRALPPRLRPYGLAAVLGGLLVLQFSSLAMMLVRFYA